MTEHDPAVPAPTPSPFPAPADAAPEPATTRHRASRRAVAFGAAALVLLGIGAGGGALAAGALHGGTQTGAFGQTQGGTQPGTQPGIQPGTQPGTGRFDQGGFGSDGFGQQGGTANGTSSSGTTATAAERAGVVTVTTSLGYSSGSAAGSGIVLTANGEILTNNHVIDGAGAVRVTDETTNRTYAARVVGTDATHDVAVLQLQHASGLTPAKLASSAAKVGDAVTAVGNAGGTGTLSAARGTITAVKQSITTSSESGDESENLADLLETDADVVSGDSGGPLVNSAGRVVGIDTAASSGTRATTGYAIPIARAAVIARTIVAGTDTADITIGYPAFLGVQVSSVATTASGAVLGAVIPNTPAAGAGLAADDVVTAIDGRTVTSASDLTSTLHTKQPGDRVRVTWTTADGATRSAVVTLIEGPAD